MSSFSSPKFLCIVSSLVAASCCNSFNATAAAVVNACNGRTALIVVDMQNDFLPATSDYQSRLPVAGGDTIIPNINRLLASSPHDGKSNHPIFDVTVVTQDYHPQDHISFWTTHAKVDETVTADNIGTLYRFQDVNGEPRQQVLWPPHCVVGETNDEFAKGVDITDDLIFDPSNVHWVRKGHDLLRDSYSAFLDNDRVTKTGLGDYLQNQNISNVVVVGLAADFCVKYSAMDALVEEGLNVYIPLDATAAVFPESWAEEQAQLEDLGIIFGTTDELLLQGGWKFDSEDCPSEKDETLSSSAKGWGIQWVAATLVGLSSLIIVV